MALGMNILHAQMNNLVHRIQEQKPRTKNELSVYRQFRLNFRKHVKNRRSQEDAAPQTEHQRQRQGLTRPFRKFQRNRTDNKTTNS